MGRSHRLLFDLCTQEQWKRDKGPASAGLELGAPCLAAVQELDKQYTKDERWEHRRILRKVCCGHYWRFPQTCEFCNAPDSPEHRYFACPGLTQYADPDKDNQKGQGEVPQAGSDSFFSGD